MYSQPITPATPGCVLFLLDQSFSTAERPPGAAPAPIHAAVAALNRALADLVQWCGQGGQVQPSFDVGVLGYTTDAAGHLALVPLLRAPLGGRELSGVADLAAHPTQLTAPPPVAQLGTPTCAALRRCREIAAAWAAAHPDSFPPVVVHLSDGEATDGDPGPAAEELKSVATRDGGLLLLSCRLSVAGGRVLLPADERELPDEPGRALFRASSPPPPPARQILGGRGVAVRPGARCVASPDALAALLGWLDPGAVVLELDAEAPEPELAAAPPPPARAAGAFRPPRCPGCDRKAPGAPGGRYCMICDRRY